MASKEHKSQRRLFVDKTLKPPEGYYVGDTPNPNLRAFVEAHQREHPFNPESDRYNVAALEKQIETTKNTAIFALHAYHLGKKPHDAIETYIEHFTKPGDLVLDPFSGSGSTAIAALIQNRKAVAIDLSPAATFITRFYVTLCEPGDLNERFENLLKATDDDRKLLYETKCHRCGGRGVIHYIIYSNSYECPRCLSEVSLFEASVHSPPCCPHCKQKRSVVEKIGSDLPIKSFMPVAVDFSCDAGCKPKRMTRGLISGRREKEFFCDFDLKQIRNIESKPIPYPTPAHFMMNVKDPSKPWGDDWRPSRNFRKVLDLFTHRNAWAIASLLQKCKTDDDLRAIVTSGMLAVSRKAQHLDEGGGYIPGTWALPPMSKQRNVFESLEKVFNKTLRGKTELSNTLKSQAVCISTQSATDLGQIPNNSVDYVFTDPPYGGAVQYGELNFIWEAWLGLDTHWHSGEITINRTRGKAEEDWANLMRASLSECFRVLKPGRWLSICYHDTSEGTWELLQDLMAEVGFVAQVTDQSLYIDTGGNTYNQRVADKVTKRDLVINFRKPKIGELAARVSFSGKEDPRTFNEKVRTIIREYLESHPGITKDRIYDEVVSSMVRSGSMEAHDFEELLEQVGVEVREPRKKNLFEKEDANLFGTHEVGRWYLKDTELAVTDAAETAKEDTAAAKLQVFIEKKLKASPEDEGVHYSDIFEQYIYLIKDKPRRLLADWLLDYFYKTEEGTYRPPASEEEERLKAETRAKGVNRRIKRFVAYLEQAVPVPASERPNDSTLAEWIRNCKRSGLFEEGKLLYEKGGLQIEHLSEDLQAGVEEDYQVCVRMLGRTAVAPAKATKGKRKKSE